MALTPPSAFRNFCFNAVMWSGAIVLAAGIICIAWPIALAHGQDINGKPLFEKE